MAVIVPISTFAIFVVFLTFVGLTVDFPQAFAANVQALLDGLRHHWQILSGLLFIEKYALSELLLLKFHGQVVLLLETSKMHLSLQGDHGDCQDDAQIEQEDGTDEANHAPPDELLVGQRWCEWKKRQVIRRHLHQTLIDVLHLAGQIGIMRSRQSKVDDVEDVAE